MKEPVSIIIPAYNEHLGVGGVVKDVIAILDEHSIPGEVIVVDDGSREIGRASCRERV